MEAGKLKFAIGQVHIRSDITWEDLDVCFAVLHLTGHILNGGVMKYENEDKMRGSGAKEGQSQTVRHCMS